MKKLVSAATLLLTLISVSAQTLIESPYSRYGLGEINTNTNAHYFSMGGTSIGFRSPFQINTANPASYSAFDSLAFLFTGGFIGQYSMQESDGAKAYPVSISFNSFAFGFRLAPFWGTAFGLQPYSSVGYEMSSSHELDSVSSYNAVYSGSGGLNKVWWGNSFKLLPGLSIGANTSYLFGTIERERKIVFDSAGFYNTKNTVSRFINDFSFDAGLQYQFIIKRDTGALNNHTWLTLGAVAGLPGSLHASEDNLTQRYWVYGGADYVIDTISVINNVEGEVSLPLYYGAGIAINNRKWTLGADFRMQDWSSYEAFGESDSLQNSMSLSIGGSLIPDNSSIAKYYKKITYMAGFHYDKTYLQLRGTQLTKIGISFGMVLPLKPVYQNRSSIKLGFEVGQMGTTDQSLIKEQYFRFVFGINIKEHWFEKRRYN
ncbi:MAG: hypothetical protein C0592_02205 [Marinilabiliales bacterium]|nr:MAG: hypothetical protein C0592_02205 [Marinilabiliales bacterium]